MTVVDEVTADRYGQEIVPGDVPGGPSTRDRVALVPLTDDGGPGVATSRPSFRARRPARAESRAQQAQPAR